MNNTDLSSKLKEARSKKGLSQNVAAEKLNVSRQAISRWETGKGSPDINMLPLISELYDISLDELLGHEFSASESKPQDTTTDSSCLGKAASNEILSEKEIVPDAVPPRVKNIFNLEYFILILLLFFSSFVVFAGLIISIYILIWTWRNRRHYKLILVLAILCILFGLNRSYTCIHMLFLADDTVTIEKIS